MNAEQDALTTLAGQCGSGKDGRQEYWWVEEGKWNVKRVNLLNLLAEPASK